MIKPRAIPLLLFTALACGCLLHAQARTSGPWVMESSGTNAGLRGIHAVGGGVAWASGSDGTVLRTEDGGYVWQRCAVPADAAKLDFRGIWAWDTDTAIVMSSGSGDLSRIYKTTDGCAHWKLMFTNPDKDGFWDAMVFQDRQLGFVLGDPVHGRFVFLTTTDGGGTWTRDKAPGLAAKNATGVFAASNTALLAGSGVPTRFGTGGGYVYAAQTMGGFRLPMKAGAPIKMQEVWTRIATPLAAPGDSSGIFSLAFRDTNRGVAVGGDYKKPNDSMGAAAWTSDGGRHWTASTKPPHGFRSAVAWDDDAKAWIAAGTNGSDISYDDGRTWIPIDNGNWNALSLPWVVGPNGRIAKLDESKLPKR